MSHGRNSASISSRLVSNEEGRGASTTTVQPPEDVIESLDHRAFANIMTSERADFTISAVTVRLDSKGEYSTVDGY